MTASKKLMASPELCEKVLNRYRSLECTMDEIAEELGTSYHTVSAILRKHVPKDELDRLRRGNYSRSKAGEKNPMLGVRYAAERIMRKGYAGVWNGKNYTMEHRMIVAKSLGLEALPPHWQVHHIDGNKLNNHIDNLALATVSGHSKLHKQRLGKLYLWEKEKYGTSLLKEMQAMSPEE